LNIFVITLATIIGTPRKPRKDNYAKNRLNITIMVRPEMTTIAGTLKVPRMINGLWQLVGGHEQDIDVAKASETMDPL
jgi:hypothetical protein